MNIQYLLLVKLPLKQSKKNIIIIIIYFYKKSIEKKIDEFFFDENMELIKSKRKEENQKELMDKHRELIFKKNYGSKILNQLNQKTNNKSKSDIYAQIKNISRNISLNEYVSYIKQNFKDNPLEYESINITNNKKHYKFSLCFICHYPVIACEDKVICVNRCFKFNIKTRIFNDDYTLDNFNEQYYEFCKKHLLCYGDVKFIYIDTDRKKAFFICEICDKATLDKAGIIL